MNEVLLALQKSLGSLGRGKIWLYMLGPAFFALLIMLGLSAALLDQLVAYFVEAPPMSWIAAWGAMWLAHLLAVLGGWALVLALTYMIAMLLTAIVVLPLLLNYLGTTDYADVARLGKGSVLASAWNSVWASLLFIIGWLVTMPLWLIPGMGLILPPLWMGWLNRKTFAYDALESHARADEWRALRRQRSGALFMLGLLMALLAHVPFMGLLAPSLAALAYVHYCLEALRRLRAGGN